MGDKVALLASEIKKGMRVRLLGATAAGRAIKVKRWKRYEGEPLTVIKVPNGPFIRVKADIGGGPYNRTFNTGHYDFALVEKAGEDGVK